MMLENHLIVFIIPLTLVILAYNLVASFDVFAQPPDPKYDTNGTCGAATTFGSLTKKTCCWTDKVPGKLPPTNKANYCQTCTYDSESGSYFCEEPRKQLGTSPNIISPEDRILEQPPTPTPQPSGPAAPLQDEGVLQQSPSQGVAPPLTQGQGTLPQDGILQQESTDEGNEATPQTVDQPPEDEETQSSTEPMPRCSADQVSDEETGLCVLEE
jgi:hypothetical protein